MPTSATTTLNKGNTPTGSCVFAKTDKGRDELTQRSAGLSARQRGVLIMLDGVKRLESLATPISKEELNQIITFLADHQFIENTRKRKRSQSSDTQNSDLTDRTDASATSELRFKSIASNSANAYAGSISDKEFNASANLSSLSSQSLNDSDKQYLSNLSLKSDLSGLSGMDNHPSAPAIKTSQLIQDADKIREIKDFMTVTAQTYLGLLAADIIRRIERTKDAEQLMNVLGQWHMALRDSKQGHRFAAQYMQEITANLRGENIPINLS